MAKKELTELDLEKKKIRNAHTIGGLGIGAGAGVAAGGVFTIVTAALGGIAGGIVLGTVLPVLGVAVAIGGIFGLFAGILLGRNDKHVESHLKNRKEKEKEKENKPTKFEKLKKKEKAAAKEAEALNTNTAKENELIVKNKDGKILGRYERVYSEKNADLEDRKFYDAEDLKYELSRDRIFGEGLDPFVFEYNGKSIAGYMPYENEGTTQTRMKENTNRYNNALDRVMGSLFEVSEKANEVRKVEPVVIAVNNEEEEPRF